MWKLVNEEGHEIEKGSLLRSFRGDEYILRGFSPPRHENSSGRVHVTLKVDADEPGYNTAEFFPSVFDLRIIETEEK